MSKNYVLAGDAIDSRIRDMVLQHHRHLETLRIDALFAFSDDKEPTLTNGGYPAIATVRITPTKDRAAGLGDAMIVIDQATWIDLAEAQRDAVIDHELTHLVPVIDDNMRIKTDNLGRPKLEMRKHDRQFGWFDDVADRHGENSIEVKQARALIAETGQMYIGFGEVAEVA